MKTLERLRQIKAKAVDRMTELNNLAATEKRDLNETEKLEYERCKTEAEALAAEIAEVEALSTKPVTTFISAIGTGTGTLSSGVVSLHKPETVDTEALAKQATDAERARVTLIRTRLNSSRLPADVVTTLEKELVETGATAELASEKIFAAMARHDEKQPETKTGLAVGRGGGLEQIETLARQVAERDSLSIESAKVRVINQNPKLYDQYLAANPAQTGARQ